MVSYCRYCIFSIIVCDARRDDDIARVVTIRYLDRPLRFRQDIVVDAIDLECLRTRRHACQCEQDEAL